MKMEESRQRQRNSQSSSVARDVVAEDDAAHARLSGPGLAHEEDLLLLRLLDLVADIGAGVWRWGLAKGSHDESWW